MRPVLNAGEQRRGLGLGLHIASEIARAHGGRIQVASTPAAGTTCNGGSSLSSTTFNDDEVLRAIRPAGSRPNGVVQLFYNDEHAMTLGVRQVAVKAASGATTTDYPITALATDPSNAIWNVSLVPGHSYRLQVLVHDGDQNKTGGDSGEACVLFCAGTGSCGSECSTTETGDGGAPQCPAGTAACGSGGVNPATCPSGTVCANGCCLPDISIS